MIVTTKINYASDRGKHLEIAFKDIIYDVKINIDTIAINFADGKLLLKFDEDEGVMFDKFIKKPH